MRFCVSAVLIVILCGLRLHAGDEPTAEEPLERWDRAVCLAESRTDDEGKKSVDAGTAFVVADGERMLLVSAGHVAKLTTENSRVFYRDRHGDSKWIKLGGMTAKNGEPWRYHDQSDLAVMPLDGSKVEPDAFASLCDLAIPVDAILTDVPARMTAIEIAGFPMLLGVDPAVSPLVMKAHVASRELPVAAKWGHEQIVFANPVVGPGTSGGPTFISSASPTDVHLMGICIGYMHDKSGYRLAKLVPGRLIVDLVKQQVPAKDP